MTSNYKRLEKSSSSKALVQVVEERRVGTGSNMQQVRSCGALPQIGSNKKADDSETDDSAVWVLSDNAGAKCRTKLSTEAKSDSLSPTDVVSSAKAPTIATWDEEEESCNSAREFPNCNPSSVILSLETKKDPVPSDLVCLANPKLPLKRRSQAAQCLSPKALPTGKLLPSFRQHMNMLDSFKVSSRENDEADICRQAPLILKDSYQAIMYECKPRHSKDYFAPYVGNNRVKIMSNTKDDNELILTTSGKRSRSIKKIFSRAKNVTPREQTRPRQRWEMRDLPRMQKRLYQIQNLRANYYTNFLHITGRVNPYFNILLLLIWTTIVLVFHREYGDWKPLGLDWTMQITSNAPNYLGIALGYLLYMQARVSSRRWWQGRIEWQMLMNKSKSLAIDFNTKLRFVRLTKFGCRLIVAHTTSVWCFLQDKDDKGWYRELSNILDSKTITRIMRNSRRLRPFAILYAFQRMIEVSILEGIIPRDVVRDINPMLNSLSNSFDACNRSRIAQFPYIMAVHLSFIVLIYLVMLPLTLVVVESEYNRVDIDVYNYKAKFIYAYVVLISYSFFGLYEMAVVIEDPFSFKKEHHSFGFWGLWEYWTAIQISDIRNIFGFHIREIIYGEKNSCGTYGETWSAEKFDPPILRAVENGILKNGEKIKANMENNRVGQSFFDLFSNEKHYRSSVISLSTMDDGKHEVGAAKVSNNTHRIYEDAPEEKKITPNSSSTLMKIAPLPKI